MLVVDLRPGRLGGGGRHPRQDHDDVDADARARRVPGCARASSSAATSPMWAPEPSGPRALARRRGRRERRHPPRVAAPRHDPHQRRDRPPRPLRLVRRDRRQLRPVPGPGPGSEGGVRRRRRVRWRSRPATARSPTGSRPTCDVRAVDVVARPERSPSRRATWCRRSARAGRRDRAAAARTAQRHQCAPASSRWRCTRRCRPGHRCGPRPVRWRCPSIRRPGDRSATPRSSTTTRTCRPRSTPCSPRPAASGDGWQRVIGVFQPNRYNRIAEMWHEYADAFADADLVVLTDIYPSGTVPIPGVTGKLIVNAVTEAHPELRVVWLPRRDDLVTFLPTRSAPVTCASRWDAATSPRCRVRCSMHAGDDGDRAVRRQLATMQRLRSPNAWRLRWPRWELWPNRAWRSVR